MVHISRAINGVPDASHHVSADLETSVITLKIRFVVGVFQTLSDCNKLGVVFRLEPFPEG